MVAIYVPTNHLYLGDIIACERDAVSFPTSRSKKARIFLTGGMALPTTVRNAEAEASAPDFEYNSALSSKPFARLPYGRRVVSVGPAGCRASCEVYERDREETCQSPGGDGDIRGRTRPPADGLCAT